MICPLCNGKTRVKDCTSDDKKNYRKRKCQSCGNEFYTVETVDNCKYQLNNLREMRRRKIKGGNI